jgi:hypothetical protein
VQAPNDTVQLEFEVRRGEGGELGLCLLPGLHVIDAIVPGS